MVANQCYIPHSRHAGRQEQWLWISVIIPHRWHAGRQEQWLWISVIIPHSRHAGRQGDRSKGCGSVL